MKLKRTTLKIISIGLLLMGMAVHAGTVSFVYTDPQGTPLVEADAQGNIIATFDYRPNGSQALGQASSGPGYTWHVNDPDTGLVYMLARYFDPAVGRFLSVDPVTPAAGNLFNFNRYDYTNNSPINHVDPEGRCIWDGCRFEAIVVAAVLGGGIDAGAQKYFYPDTPIN
jgi:RHS repeat-associated protein